MDYHSSKQLHHETCQISHQRNRAGEELWRQILEDLGEGGVVEVEKVRLEGLVWEQLDRDEVEMATSIRDRT